MAVVGPAEAESLEVEPPESQFGSTRTSSAVMIDAALGQCHLSKCNFADFAGSFPGLMDLMSLVDSGVGVAVDLNLHAAAVAGSGHSGCTTSQVVGVSNCSSMNFGCCDTFPVERLERVQYQ